MYLNSMLTYVKLKKKNALINSYSFLAFNLCESATECSHGCNNSPNGLVCICPENMTLQDDRRTCSTCDTWGHCSQKCVETGKNVHKCTCNDGYLLAGDHFTCKSTGIFEYSIIYTTKMIY